jgi:hypothetical protein
VLDLGLLHKLGCGPDELLAVLGSESTNKKTNTCDDVSDTCPIEFDDGACLGNGTRMATPSIAGFRPRPLSRIAVSTAPIIYTSAGSDAQKTNTNK